MPVEMMGIQVRTSMTGAATAWGEDRFVSTNINFVENKKHLYN